MPIKIEEKGERKWIDSVELYQPWALVLLLARLQTSHATFPFYIWQRSRVGAGWYIHHSVSVESLGIGANLTLCRACVDITTCWLAAVSQTANISRHASGGNFDAEEFSFRAQSIVLGSEISRESPTTDGFGGGDLVTGFGAKWSITTQIWCNDLSNESREGAGSGGEVVIKCNEREQRLHFVNCRAETNVDISVISWSPVWQFFLTSACSFFFSFFFFSFFFSSSSSSELTMIFHFDKTLHGKSALFNAFVAYKCWFFCSTPHLLRVLNVLSKDDLL